MTTSVDVYMSSVNGSAGVYLAARVEHGGCTSLLTRGLFFFLHQDRGLFEITLDLGKKVYFVSEKSCQLIKQIMFGINFSERDKNLVF